MFQFRSRHWMGLIRRIAEVIDYAAFTSRAHLDSPAMRSRRRRALQLARQVLAVIGEELIRGARRAEAEARADDDRLGGS